MLEKIPNRDNKINISDLILNALNLAGKTSKQDSLALAASIIQICFAFFEASAAFPKKQLPASDSFLGKTIGRFKNNPDVFSRDTHLERMNQFIFMRP
jgi:hypothetical protein